MRFALYFPHGKHKEGIAVGKKIRKERISGVFCRLQNTLAYSDEELVELAEEMNQINPVASFRGGTHLEQCIRRILSGLYMF